MTSAPVSDPPFSVALPQDAPARRRRPGWRTVVAVLASVAGLTGLVAAQVVVVAPRVEGDLARRSREALADAGITTVTVRVHGRDVVLAGTAADDRQAFVAEHVVDTVDGVRFVDTAGLVVGGAPGPTPTAKPTATPTAAPARTPGATAGPGPAPAALATLPGTGADATGTLLTVVADGGKAVVAGAFATLADRRTFVRALEQTYGAGDVQAEANANGTAPTAGSDGVAAVLAALGPDARAVTVTLAGGRITVVAQVADEAARTVALAAAAKAVSGPAAVRERVVVAPAGTAPAVSTALGALPVLSFGDGQATPGPIGRGVLVAAAFLLNAYPDATVTLEGHTDDTGDAVADKAASLARAKACEDFLATVGVAPARVSTVGAGSAPVGSADGGTSNRRLVVR